LPSEDGLSPRSASRDRARDVVDRGLVERVDDEDARLRDGEVRELLDRRRGAVVLHDDAVEQLRVRTPGADGREVLADLGDGLAHAVLGVGHDRFDAHRVLL
jgi:hypothetical protein